jgi:dipeptidase
MYRYTRMSLITVLLWVITAGACTNYLITAGASSDGSTMITYSADSHTLYGELNYIPPGKHLPGEMLEIREWDSGKRLGQIPQAPETYSVVGNMNEYQVSIGETTWDGRPELVDSTSLIDYGSMMFLALQRSKSAREAIEVMTDLVSKYGYYSTGESFSIADPREVWIMDIIGKGPGGKGALWVARRIPDGYISAHANQARIHQFPLNDPKNCLYAKDVISFAREKKYYEGTDENFSYANAYAPVNYEALRFCEIRVWAMFRRIAPSLALSSDYVKGIPGAEPLPLWIRPDKKLSVRDVMELMRDHFEGTEFDLTKGIGAGPYRLPYRWRPLTWKVDSVEYLNDRATSTQQTGFSFVAQARSWLPDPVGGVFWFGVDDTYSTCYHPIYCGITRVPAPFAVGNGSFHQFTWESAFWVFNFVSNFSYLRYCDMIQDVQRVQQEIEGRFMSELPEIDRAALALYGQAPHLAREYLTGYDRDIADETLKRWKKLGEFLLYKYLDGNVKDEKGNVTHPGYPEFWYHHIAEEAGEQLRMKKMPDESSVH